MYQKMIQKPVENETGIHSKKTSWPWWPSNVKRVSEHLSLDQGVSGLELFLNSSYYFRDILGNTKFMAYENRIGWNPKHKFWALFLESLEENWISIINKGIKLDKLNEQLIH